MIHMIVTVSHQTHHYVSQPFAVIQGMAFSDVDRGSWCFPLSKGTYCICYLFQWSDSVKECELSATYMCVAVLLRKSVLTQQNPAYYSVCVTWPATEHDDTYSDDVVQPSNGASCVFVAALTTRKAVAQRCRLTISPQWTGCGIILYERRISEYNPLRTLPSPLPSTHLSLCLSSCSPSIHSFPPSILFVSVASAGAHRCQSGGGDSSDTTLSACVCVCVMENK